MARSMSPRCARRKEAGIRSGENVGSQMRNTLSAHRRQRHLLDAVATLEPPPARRSARFHSQLFQDSLDMLFDGSRADFQNKRDLAIAFSFRDPINNFSLAQGQRVHRA